MYFAIAYNKDIEMICIFNLKQRQITDLKKLTACSILHDKALKYDKKKNRSTSSILKVLHVIKLYVYTNYFKCDCYYFSVFSKKPVS